MSGKIKTSISQDVTVKVTMFSERYEVEILIPEEARKQEMHIKNQDFIFRLKMKSKWYGVIRIILKGNYIKDERGLVNIRNYAKLEFDRKSYSGSVSLNPNFYLSAKTRKKVRDEKKKNQEIEKAFKKCIVNTSKPPKPSTSIYTNYTHNNATKPFSGGLVAPK